MKIWIFNIIKLKILIGKIIVNISFEDIYYIDYAEYTSFIKIFFVLKTHEKYII